MERAELIRDVIQAAVEFHQRQLWKRFSNFDCFAVRVPGIDAPLLACVMGAAGEQYGLMLLRGPRAVEHLGSLLSDDGPGDDAPEEMSMLSFSMDVFGDMAAESRAFFRQAGIHPRHEDQVPGFLVKPPGRQPRMPNDSELALFLTVLKTAVAADRRRLLTPARLDDADGICVVTLGGDLTDPTISVTRERLRRQARAPQAAPLPAARMDLSGLDLLDETWLVGTPAVPGGIKGDGRSMQLVLVAEDSSGMVLQACPVLADQTSEAVAALAETFRGRQPGGRRGLPRTIVFSSRKLHDAVAPSLRQAGVKCVFMATIPQLQEIAADFVKFLNRDLPSLSGGLDAEGHDDNQVPAPDDLAGWKGADLRLSQRFADFLRQGGLLRLTRAAKRYFDDDDIRHFFEEHEQQGVAMAYSSWGILDYRPTRGGTTQAEKMLAEGIPPAQEMLLRARMETHPTVYRVAGRDPKAGTVDLEDVLLAGTVTVHDQLLSENIDNNLFLVARAFAAGRFHFIEVAGPPLGAGMGMEAVEFLRDCRMDFTPEGMRRDAHKFGWLWGWIERWQANWKPPRLTNTDGDELLWHTASFSVADPSAARQGLFKRPDIDHNEEEDEFVWINDVGKGVKMLGGPVTLGRIEFVGDELVLTVNSARRFEKARVWLEGLPGVAFRNVATRRWDEPQEARPADERMSKPQPVEITPEMTAALQEMTDSQYMGWVDTPLPVLGGKTPRQACRTPAGRQQVALLIRTMPDPMGQAPVHVPRHAMLRELGLADESPASPPASPRPPSLLPAAETPALAGKVGRNDPCPCGSGKKYKKCCGR